MTTHHPKDHPAPHFTEWGSPSAEAELAVLAIHGREQSPAFMRETAERFGPVAVRFYAPQATRDSWYPRPFMEPIKHNQPDLDAALTVVNESFDVLADRGFAPHRVVLWGFSQGACLLAHHALTFPRRIAALMLFTGGYIGPSRPALPETSALQQVPVLLRSVSADPWIPASRVRDTAAIFTALGAEVDVRIDPGAEHEIREEACTAATHLMRRLA